MQPGDVVVLRAKEGHHGVVKILRIDPAPGGGETFHCLCYAPVAEMPTPEMIGRLTVLTWHAPIDGGSIRREGRTLCAIPLRREELLGFYKYLKQTDFDRYLRETGQDLDALVEAAQSRYREGCRLADERRFDEAVKEYTAAIEIIPRFTEAMDNRGLAYMDLGDLDSAVADFQNSLSIDPNNPTAFFSLGECFAKQGRLEETEKILAEGASRWPEQKHFARFLRVIRKQRGGGRPWWKFWGK